jgi:beta-glucanase (GH16 family)
LRTFVIMYILACTLLLKAQVKDSLEAYKKPVRLFYFKNKMSVRNASLKFRYLLNRHPKNQPDSVFLSKGWKLSFYDNFDRLDTKKWRIGQAWGEMHPLNPHQYYAASQVKTGNGYLYLGGAYEPKQIHLNDSLLTVPYAIGLINTDISFTQKYGYFEIRSKNPKGPATWPAFWLTGATKWPPEIDIFEMHGGKTGKTVHDQYATIHWGKENTRSRGYLCKKINLPNDTDTAFHTYGCEWTPAHIRFYTDGNLVNSIRINSELARWLDEEMVIVINNCFERQYLSYLPEDFKNNQFVIDWIRVYQIPLN